MSKTLNLRELDENLVHRVKVAAVAKGISVKAYVIEALKAYLPPKGFRP